MKNFDSENLAQAQSSRELALRHQLTLEGSTSERLGGVEVFRVPKPNQLLDWAVDNGFILHGTSRLVDGDFVPNTAADSIKESGNRTAVCLTDMPPFAMFMALVGGTNVSGTANHGVHTETNDYGIKTLEFAFGISTPDKIMASGYIYLFGPDCADEFINGEYLSYKPVKPVLAVRFDRDQFAYPIQTIA